MYNFCNINENTIFLFILFMFFFVLNPFKRWKKMERNFILPIIKSYAFRTNNTICPKLLFLQKIACKNKIAHIYHKHL